MLKRSSYRYTKRPHFVAAFNYPVANPCVDNVIEYSEPSDELFYAAAVEAVYLTC